MENKVKIVPVFSSTTLEQSATDTQAATSRKIVDTYLSDQMNLVVQYTTGASETATRCYMQAHGYVGTKTEVPKHPYSAGSDNSDILGDSDNWILIGDFDNPSGECMFTAKTFRVDGGVGGTLYTAHFSFPITFPKVYFTAWEDGINANKGTLTAKALIQ